MNQNALMAMGGALATADPAAIAAAEAAKARIQAAYIMALQKPRNVEDARAAIHRACRRSEFAEAAEFKKPVGGGTVRGGSIRFAEECVRQFGNLLIETQVLFEDDFTKRIRVSAIDLETNSQFSRDMQFRKTVERRSMAGRSQDDLVSERQNTKGKKVFVVKATEDELLTKEGALVSKIVRNLSLALIPADIVNEGLRICRETVAARVASDPDAEKKRIMDGFAALGIKPSNLARYVGHSLDTITPAEIISLKEVYRALRDGESTWADYEAEIAARGSAPDAPDAPDVEPPADENVESQFAALRQMIIDEVAPVRRGPEERARCAQLFDDWVENTAKVQDVTVAEIKKSATDNAGAVKSAFGQWYAAQHMGAKTEDSGDAGAGEGEDIGPVPETGDSTRFGKDRPQNGMRMDGAPMWWMERSNWINWQAENFGHAVRIGFGFTNPREREPGDEISNDEIQSGFERVMKKMPRSARGTIRNCDDEIKAEIKQKFVRHFGIEAFKSLVVETGTNGNQ